MSEALSNGVAGQQVISIIERVERLEEEKRNISDDIKEVYDEAKGNGHPPKILRKIDCGHAATSQLPGDLVLRLQRLRQLFLHLR